MQVLEKAKEFEKDFAEMMSTIGVVAAKHGLPTPTVVIDRKWEAPIRSMPVNMTASAESWGQFFGISFVFGNVEPGKVVR